MKLRKALLTLVVVTALSLFLVSCGEKPQAPHEHSWGEWEVLNPATCTSEGLKGRDCTVCDKFER